MVEEQEECEENEKVKKAREYIKKKRQEISKKRETKKKKEEARLKKQEEETMKGIEKLNKKYGTELVTFGKSKVSNVQWIDSGMNNVNIVLSGKENGGWPRGRVIELFGPEGSGKTWILSQVYAAVINAGGKACHYDVEGTYSKPFAEMNGVDITKLHYSYKDKCEKVFEEIESFCINDEFDIIGIDSLAALIPQRTLEVEMGKKNYGELAHTVSLCIGRLNSAVKTSKTVLMVVNQLRDNIGNRYGESERTPGGRALKFYSTIRVDVRRVRTKKEDYPYMFDGNDKQIGHRLKVYTKKNKVYEPGHECFVDLMYRMPSSVMRIVSEAIEKDVIERQRTKSGDLRGRKLTYKDMVFVPENKYDAGETLLWLKENKILCPLLSEMGIEDLEEFIESGDLTEEVVENFLIENM